MNTLLVVGAVIPVTLLFVFALCKAAAKPAPRPQICTRRAPHECAVNGPCNGFPKRGTYAEGRPTMPSEPENDIEQARRLR
jgi:hypothetical protein